MIRRALAGDIQRVASLYHAVWHETQAPFMPAEERAFRSSQFFIQRMTALLQTTLVVEQYREIVGFSAWKGQLLGQIFVASSSRGSGVAQSLMTATEAEMAKEGITEAELHCVVGNDRARRFYERVGWRHSGAIMEQVLGANGPVDLSFWRMTKVLPTLSA